MAKYARADKTLLAMALVGYEQEKSRIEAAIAELRAQLGGTGSAPAAAGEAAPKKRVLSASARRRIALAQKKRWAAQRKEKGAAARPRRTMSAAGRAAIVAAAKKRWAAFHKAQAGSQKKAGSTKGRKSAAKTPALVHANAEA